MEEGTRHGAVGAGESPLVPLLPAPPSQKRDRQWATGGAAAKTN